MPVKVDDSWNGILPYSSVKPLSGIVARKTKSFYWDSISVPGWQSYVHTPSVLLIAHCDDAVELTNPDLTPDKASVRPRSIFSFRCPDAKKPHRLPS